MFDFAFGRFKHLSEPCISLTPTQASALEAFRTRLSTGAYRLEHVPCLCGNNNSLTVARVDRYALPVHTRLCQQCGIMWTSPRLNADSLAKFYETDYRLIYAGNRKATESFFSEQVARGEDILKYVEDCLDMPRNRVIFDIGCGAGGVLLPFQDKGFETYGCDLGGEYLERGKAAGLRLDQGDWSILSRHGKAHLVILNHVLEHLPYPLDMLRRLLELIEEDGYIYIEVPGILYSYKTYGDFLLFLQNAHLYHFTLGTLTDAMKKCGYSLVKGDERIRALYKKNTLTSYEHPESQYLPILLYLITNELFRILGIPRHGLGLRSMVSKVARQLLGDRVVVQLKTLLRNQ